MAGGTGAAGRHVVQIAADRGHDVAVLSRAHGVDLLAAPGLGPRLDGIDAVIDVTSIATQSAAASRRFFGKITTALLQAEAAAGVPHHVALSIVGADRAPFGYYAGKQLQERLVQAGPVPWTILRATQFHEFAEQTLQRFRFGPVCAAPRMVSQPVAAREVAERLVALAEGAPAGSAADLAGPETLRMAHLVRETARALGISTRVVELPLPGGFGRALRDGTLLGGADADRGVLTFAEWVAQLRTRGAGA